MSVLNDRNGTQESVGLCHVYMQDNYVYIYT